MISVLKKISIAGQGLLLLCFLLPFVSVSCNNHKIQTFTAQELVTGTTMNLDGKTQKIAPERCAIYAVSAALLGLLFSIIQNRTAYILSLLSNVIGIGALYLLKQKLNNDIQASGKGIMILEYEPGYYAIFLLFALMSILSMLLFANSKKAVEVLTASTEVKD